MGMNVGQAVSELRRMTVTELRRKYAEVFGEQTRSYHKDFLVRRIAWRMQANEEGGLPDRAEPPRLDAVAKGRRSRPWIESRRPRSERAISASTTAGLSRSLTLRLQDSGIGGRIGTGFETDVAARHAASCGAGIGQHRVRLIRLPQL